MKRIGLLLVMIVFILNCAGNNEGTIGITDIDNFLKGSVSDDKGNLITDVSVVLLQESNEPTLAKSLSSLKVIDSVYSTNGEFSFIVNSEGIYTLRAYKDSVLLSEKKEFHYILNSSTNLIVENVLSSDKTTIFDSSEFVINYLNSVNYDFEDELYVMLNGQKLNVENSEILLSKINEQGKYSFTYSSYAVVGDRILFNDMANIVKKDTIEVTYANFTYSKEALLLNVEVSSMNQDEIDGLRNAAQSYINKIIKYQSLKEI